MNTNPKPPTITTLRAPEHQARGDHHAMHQPGGRGNHWMHLLMCAPMLLVVAWALRSGGATSVVSGLAIIAPALICVGMMMLMMRLMGHGDH